MTWAQHEKEEQTADSSQVFEDIHTCQNNLLPNRSFSLSHNNKKINRKPTSGKSQEIVMS